MDIKERINEQINGIRNRNILPQKLLLASQTFRRLLTDEYVQHLMKKGNHPAIAIRKIFHLEFEIADCDMIIGKGISPEKCPICSRPLLVCHGVIYNLASAIEFLETAGARTSILACGHPVKIGVKEYRTSVDFSDAETKITVCPKCGGKIKYLTATEAFCLDCDWDNLKPLGMRG
jgi:hypothetical protein